MAVRSQRCLVFLCTALPWDEHVGHILQMANAVISVIVNDQAFLSRDSSFPSLQMGNIPHL